MLLGNFCIRGITNESAFRVCEVTGRGLSLYKSYRLFNQNNNKYNNKENNDIICFLQMSQLLSVNTVEKSCKMIMMQPLLVKNLL